MIVGNACSLVSRGPITSTKVGNARSDITALDAQWRRARRGDSEQQALQQPAAESVALDKGLFRDKPQQDAADGGGCRYRHPRGEAGRRLPAPQRPERNAEHGNAPSASPLPSCSFQNG